MKDAAESAEIYSNSSGHSNNVKKLADDLFFRCLDVMRVGEGVTEESDSDSDSSEEGQELERAHERQQAPGGQQGPALEGGRGLGGT